ncbi:MULTISPECIES: hypothetical protein [Streptomyces]|uniref:hypothetical protein n=1 Tax=Streptomyces TaxID=1883 RepID=UPI000B293DA5|nr:MULTISPECIES: hypothetical protein [Streptomyces]
MLTTLLLTVLTLAGGAATASGAAPALAFRSLPPAVTAASAPAAPQPHHTGTAHPRAAHTGHVTRPDIRHRTGHATAYDRRGPDHASGVLAEAGTGAVAQAGHEHSRAAADPAQAPRAGTGRPYLLLHAPPPPHDALAPSPPGPAGPLAGVRRIAAESFDAPGSRRGALPGVRGPPGRTTTGPTTGHPSCSADPASRPH